MKMFYRGVQFEANPETAETPVSEMAGTYRGQQVAFRKPHAKSLDSAIALKYRGNAYLR